MRQVTGDERLPIAGPWITDLEIQYVTDAVTNAWYGNANTYHQSFEAAFSEYVGRRYAIALPSCTSALHLSLLSLGIGPGDEVILPDATWIASAAPISYVGATPVFADIDAHTWCLCPHSLDECITPRTRAVIAVDLYGSMPDFDAIEEVIKDREISLIEDAAEAIGSELGGRKAGSFGETSAFSFHGSKTVTTGEGGMLVTNSEETYRRSRFLQDHGRAPGDTMFWNTEVAHKYKMSSMQAALGLAQTHRVEELVRRKREIFSWYREELHAVEGVALNSEPPGVRNSYWMVTVVLDARYGLEKAEVMRRMAMDGIDTRPFFNPLSCIPAYRDSPQAYAARERNQRAYGIAPYGINLPSGFNMSREKVSRVCESLKRALDCLPAQR